MSAKDVKNIAAQTPVALRGRISGMTHELSAAWLATARVTMIMRSKNSAMNQVTLHNEMCAH